MRSLKKISCIALAAAMLTGLAPQFTYNNKTNMKVFAAETAAQKTVYKSYGDHAVLASWDSTASTAEIKSEYNGLPVTEIDEYAFMGCRSLTSVKIPDSVTKIGESAFSMCEKLSEISIPKTVTEIGGLAFNCTPWLYSQRQKNPIVSVNNIVVDGGICGKSVKIPDNTIAISDYAFADCYELESVTIPSSVKRIGGTAFKGTPWYEKQISENLVLFVNKILVSGSPDPKYNDFMIDSEVVDNYAFAETKGFGDCVFQGMVTTIGDYAFYSCTDLSSFDMYAPVKTIGDHAFEGCTAMKKFTFNTKATEKIGDSAFEKCSALTELDIPSTVKSVGEDAFKKCKSLTKITFNNAKTFIYDSADTISSTATIYGYASSTAHNYATKYNRKFVQLDNPGSTSSTTTTTSSSTSSTTTTTTTTAPPADKYTVITIPHVPEGTRIVVICISGDVDNNNTVDASDASTILAEYAQIQSGGKSILTSEQRMIADLNGDGIVDASDASGVLAYYSFTATGGNQTICDYCGVQPKIKGDVNGDGYVELTDLATLKMYVSKSGDIKINTTNADMNDDGVVDLTDLSLLSQKLMKANVKGDVDGDGEVGITDLPTLKQYISKVDGVKINESNADINDDGDVDLTDLSLLSQMLLKSDDKPDVLKGDVDGDGEVGITDLATLKQYISKTEGVKINEANADIDDSGAVDITDLSLLSQMLMS